MNEANYEDWDRATEQRLKDWLSTHPDDPEVIFTLGLLEKRQSRYAQAEEYYRKAIQIAPQFSEAFSNLGNVYFAKKQTDLAITSYQQAIDLNPEQASLLLQPLPRLFPRDLPFGKDRSGLPKGKATRSQTGGILYLDRYTSPYEPARGG